MDTNTTSKVITAAETLDQRINQLIRDQETVKDEVIKAALEKERQEAISEKVDITLAIRKAVRSVIDVSVKEIRTLRAAEKKQAEKIANAESSLTLFIADGPDQGNVRLLAERLKGVVSFDHINLNI